MRVNELYKKSEDFALKTQRLKNCRDECEMCGFLQKYKTDQFEKKIKQLRKHIKAQGKEHNKQS